MKFDHYKHNNIGTRRIPELSRITLKLQSGHIARKVIDWTNTWNITQHFQFYKICWLHYQSDMGLGKSEKGGKWCRGLGAAVGPQWGPGAKLLVGVWGQRPQKLKVFSVCHHKNSILEHENQIYICKSVSFMFRLDIYLVILKIALKCHSGAQKIRY